MEGRDLFHNSMSSFISGYRASFPGVKRPAHDVHQPPPSFIKELSYLYSLWVFMACIQLYIGNTTEIRDTAHTLYHYNSDERIVNRIAERQFGKTAVYLLQRFYWKKASEQATVRYKVNFQTTSCTTKPVRTQGFMSSVPFSYFYEHLPSKHYPL